MKLKLIGAAFGVLIGSAAQADVVYSYTSLPLVPEVSGGVPLGSETSPLSISLDFSDDGRTLLDWSAHQTTVGTIDPTNAAHLPLYGLGTTFHLYTDASGAVRAWYINAYTAAPMRSDGSVGYRSNLFSFNEEALGTIPPYDVQSEDLGVLTATDGSSFIYIGGGPGPSGTWTSTGALANLSFIQDEPPYVAPSPVPEPGNVAVLLAGLGVIGASFRFGKVAPWHPRTPDALTIGFPTDDL